MGDVYRALHTGLRKEVALKVIGDLDSQRAVEDRDVRFEREARTIAVLDHPNCVRVLDYGRTRKHQYIAMQLLDGTTLAQALRTGGRMATARAVN
ncbi:MAG: protein kinase, partial [Deltaproteobacteria bacterium]|nr:protein kinase [Deltaproteobacteria bacterium]